jgi:hypothetical protein
MADNKVQSRDIDYAALVRKQWGKEWGKRDTAYEFSNGRKFEQTDAFYTNYIVPTASDILALEPAAWFRKGAVLNEFGVLYWPDGSGNNRRLILNNSPTVGSDGSVLFNGTNQYGKTADFTLIQPETIYLLMKQVTWTGADYIFDGNAVNSGAMRQVSTTPRIDLFAGGQSSADNANLPVDTWGVVTGVINGASSITMVNNTLTSNSGALSGDMSGFTLGARGDGAASFGNIQVKEVIVFPAAHDATTRADVIRYLAALGDVTL